MRGRKFTGAEYSHAQTVLTNPDDWLLVKIEEWTWTVVNRHVGQVKQVRNERWVTELKVNKKSLRSVEDLSDSSKNNITVIIS